MLRYTPGPWEISTLDGRTINGHYYYNRDGHLVTPCIATVKERTGQAEANARLIAAAPELLEACEMVMAVCESPDYWNGQTKEFLLAVQAAIAKAKGGRTER